MAGKTANASRTRALPARPCSTAQCARARRHALNGTSPAPADTRPALLRPIIFIKTHKTGSTTLATALTMGLAKSRNLAVMQPPQGHRGSGLQFIRPFPGTFQDQWRSKQYDLLAFHTVLDLPHMRPYMRATVPGARPLVVTIVREPVNRMTSSLNYGPWQEGLSPAAPPRGVHGRVAVVRCTGRTTARATSHSADAYPCQPRPQRLAACAQ